MVYFVKHFINPFRPFLRFSALLRNSDFFEKEQQGQEVEEEKDKKKKKTKCAAVLWSVGLIPHTGRLILLQRITCRSQYYFPCRELAEGDFNIYRASK